MTRWSSDPEAAALALIAGALDGVPLGDHVLLAAGPAALALQLATPQRDVVRWGRRTSVGAIVAGDPPSGPFSAALLRLPKSREEQLMVSEQCLSTLTPDGRLIVYGGNDEGIRSFHKNLSALGAVETLAPRGHGRVLTLARSAVTVTPRGGYADWRQQSTDARRWVSYPGLFAAGSADAGTELLLAHLPPLSEAVRVLDYGAGPGAIAAAIRRARPDTDLTLLDNDALALIAAAENVAGARGVLGDRLAAVMGQRFDWIVSNPPLHVGFKDDTTALDRLIAEAPAHLLPNGRLLLVVQRRIALDRALGTAFARVETLADDGRYRVWCARTAM